MKGVIRVASGVQENAIKSNLLIKSGSDKSLK